jgi:PAS domain S-box-containing protein
MNELAALRKRVAELEAAEAERQKAEEALRQSEDNLRNYLEHAPDGVYINDLKGTFLYGNKKAEQIIGYSREELLGKSFLRLKLLPWSHLARAGKLLALSALGRPTGPDELELIRKDGSHVWVEINTARIAQRGKALVIGFVRDVTERKKAEELKRSHDELRRFATQLQLVREEERAAVAWELHDEVGQSLAALQMDLHWLQGRLPKDDAELLEKANSMSRLTRSNTERLRRLYMELRPGMLDDLGLSPTIEWEAEDFQKRTGIKPVLSLDEDADPRDAGCCLALYRVLQQALDNVSRHARATEVNISLTKTGNRTVLEIADNGRGITKKQFLAPGSPRLIGMRERVRPWGGDVEITGVRGKGTTVRVSVPVGRGEQT